MNGKNSLPFLLGQGEIMNVSDNMIEVALMKPCSQDVQYSFNNAAALKRAIVHTWRDIMWEGVPYRFEYPLKTELCFLRLSLEVTYPKNASFAAV
jgi:hypothetical protein